MIPENIGFAAFGAIVIIVAWLPLAIRRLPLSLPMVSVVAGAAMVFLSGWGSVQLRPNGIGEKIVLIALILSVMAAGLRIDRPFRIRDWLITWRLLGIALPLSIAGIALCGWWLIGLPAPVAFLVAAMISPTDPVLAARVQTGPPGSGPSDNVRFALTSEAGLNDGLAFPFILLGLQLVSGTELAADSLAKWFLLDLLLKTAVAAALGAVLGWGLVRSNQILPQRFHIVQSGNALVALGLTFLAYGLAEIIGVNGFVAVFAAAVALRNKAELLDYTRELYDAAEHIGHTGMAVVLLLFGGTLVASNVLGNVSWAMILWVFATFFVVRPLSVAAALLGSGVSWSTTLLLSYFGIRGLASIFYASYVFSNTKLSQEDLVWTSVCVTVLASIFIYGSTAGAMLRVLPRQRASVTKKTSSPQSAAS